MKGKFAVVGNAKALLLLMLLTFFGLANVSGDVANMSFARIGRGEYAIVGFNGTARGTLVIPSARNGLPVTRIESSAFSRHDIAEMIISDSITFIGEWAFYGNRLASVVIPDGVTYIGANAFQSNYIESLIIGSGVTLIGSRAFMDNLLTCVVIPDSVANKRHMPFG